MRKQTLLQFKSLLHWQYSAVLLPFLFGGGIAFVQLANFILAYVFFVLFGLVLVCWWLTTDAVLSSRSEYLSTKTVARKKQRLSNRFTSKLSKVRRRYILSWYVVTSLWIVLTASLLLYTNREALAYELKQLEGVLYPGSEPTPPNMCGNNTKPGEMLLLFGRSGAITDGNLLSLISINFEPAVWLTKSKNGAALLNGTFRDSDGAVIVEVVDGRFTANPNRLFSFKRRNRSNLVIRDQYGGEVFNVTYLNPQTLKFTGVYRYSPMGKVTVTNDSVNTGRDELMSVCLNAGHSYGAAAIGIRTE